MTRNRLLLAVAVLLLIPVSVTAGHAGTTDPCDRAHAKKQVKRFVEAYNRGSFGELDQLFAPEPAFAQYRMWPERDFPAAADRSRLISYFRERHSLGDRIELVALHSSEQRGADGLWGFSWELRRSSDDVVPFGDGTFHGKGGIACRIVSWSGGRAGP